MVKKILWVLETLILIGVAIFLGVTLVQKSKIIADRDLLVTQNAQLQQKVDSIGLIGKVYTVKSQRIANTMVTPDDLVEMSIPVTAIPEDAITDLTDIVYVDKASGAKQFKYYKVTVNPQTMLTQDLLMNEDYTQPLYERDIYLNWLPIGLKANDCIDLRISYPDGTDLVVFSHKRVYMVVDNVIKVKLTYPELVRYTSLLTEYDFYTANSVGVRIYATAYIEPGLTKETAAQVLYPVSEGAAVLVLRDPNIKNKTELINENLRTYLDAKMCSYLEDEAVKFGVYSKQTITGNETSALNGAAARWTEMYVDNPNAAIEQPTDLTGTGWDGELVNGGAPYKRPDGGEQTLGEDGTTSLGSGTGTEALGSLGSGDGMDTLNQKVNDATDFLNEYANQQQQRAENGEQGTTAPPVMTNPTQPAVQETLPAVQQPTQPAETQPSDEGGQDVVAQETQAAADAEGHQQGITEESKAAARQSGNLFSGAASID